MHRTQTPGATASIHTHSLSLIHAYSLRALRPGWVLAPTTVPCLGATVEPVTADRHRLAPTVQRPAKRARTAAACALATLTLPECHNPYASAEKAAAIQRYILNGHSSAHLPARDSSSCPIAANGCRSQKTPAPHDHAIHLSHLISPYLHAPKGSQHPRHKKPTGPVKTSAG